MVKVVEANEMRGLGDVLLQAVGLTGAIALGALVFGLLLATVIVVYRKLRTRWEPEDEASQTQSLGLTPTARR